MHLFKSQLLQEAPRHVAGPYARPFAPRYGRRRAADANPAASESRDDIATRQAQRDILRRMADYDIAA